jgi:hypothetical protein
MRTAPHRAAHRSSFVALTAALLTIPAVVGTSAARASTPADHATPSVRGPSLLGRAVLPFDTFAEGPPAGGYVVPGTGEPGSGVVNGVAFPLPAQPVEGFSAIVAGKRPGEYLAMADNGFGSKLNSRDFLIRAYAVRPQFKTAHGGSGNVRVGEFISFRDPDHRLSFPIVNDATGSRLLTGADIDPESLQRGHNGELWVGDEFGPWILHFNAHGKLLDAPYELPGIRSPNNPFLGGAPATQPNSRGFEAMGISPDGRYLYAALEGATVAEAGQLGRNVYEFSVARRSFTGRVLHYRSEVPVPPGTENLVSDMWAISGGRAVVMERDAGRGLAATFRKAYLVDLRHSDEDGFLVKTELVDLAAIPDPDLVSLPALHAGDVGLGNPFRVTCESIEAVHVVSADRILFGCDNNFPNSGRNPGLPDDNEFILVAVPGLRSSH